MVVVVVVGAVLLPRTLVQLSSGPQIKEQSLFFISYSNRRQVLSQMSLHTCMIVKLKRKRNCMREELWVKVG